MAAIKFFQVYKTKKDGSLWHVTSLRANNLKEAILENAKSAVGKDKYRVVGITLDTGKPYDDRDFPFHIYKRIENKGIKKREVGYMYQYAK